MSQINRNDIAIMITTDGSVYVAQGRPAEESIRDDEVAAYDGGLYYSQLAHRAAVRAADGSVRICTPSEMRDDETGLVGFRGYGRCTGQARRVGAI